MVEACTITKLEHFTVPRICWKTGQMQNRNSLRGIKTGLRFHKCTVTPSWAFFKTPPPFLWPQPAHPQDPFYLSGKQVVMIVRPSTYDGGSCLHVFSVWNAAFANTHSGLGGTQQIFLVTPVTLIKTPPPTPAQLFQVIPQFNYIPRSTCCCSDICTSEQNAALMEMLPCFKVNDKSS